VVSIFGSLAARDRAFQIRVSRKEPTTIDFGLKSTGLTVLLVRTLRGPFFLLGTRHGACVIKASRHPP
jgi:hypothetical protein